MIESNWLYEAAQTHQQQLIDEAARDRRIGASDHPRAAGLIGLRGWAALRLRRMADRLEPVAVPEVGVLRAVAHDELDIDQALWLLGPARTAP